MQTGVIDMLPYLANDAWQITDAIAVAVTVAVCPYLEHNGLEGERGVSICSTGADNAEPQHSHLLPPFPVV